MYSDITLHGQTSEAQKNKNKQTKDILFSSLDLFTIILKKNNKRQKEEKQ